jgi:glycosyltransferase involved in cell wall biosynthesis
MRIALIADTFPPLRASGAVQLLDLSREFIRQGHTLTVILPSPNQRETWKLEELERIQVLRLRVARYKDVSYFRRMLAELIMPFSMIINLYLSPLAKERWEGIVWYSPSIFHGPLVKWLKKKNTCKGYLIVRDIFPQWALDLGLIKKGLAYHFLNSVERYQYSLSDVIGVQTHGNLEYFNQWNLKSGCRVEVLQNWLGKESYKPCSIRISNTSLAGRKVFVYAGNVGVAQNLDIVIDLAEKLTFSMDLGFLIVGRGSEFIRLKTTAEGRQLNNMLFLDEINHDEIPDLYSQCACGLVMLDSRHKTHNIPGKFITYMRSGLPVLANINLGNDLADLIRNERVGEVCESDKLEDLNQLAKKLISDIALDSSYSSRCRQLFKNRFSVEGTVEQVIYGLSSNSAQQIIN